MIITTRTTGQASGVYSPRVQSLSLICSGLAPRPHWSFYQFWGIFSTALIRINPHILYVSSARAVNLLPFSRQPAMATKSKLFLLETFDLLSCTTIFGAFYGVTFSLYCLCARPLYLKLQNPEKRRQAGFLLLYISFLFFCVTGVFALSARIIQLAYVNHADYPGGPFAYEISYSPAIDPYQVTADILDFIIEVLTMAIQVGHQPNFSTSLNTPVTPCPP